MIREATLPPIKLMNNKIDYSKDEDNVSRADTETETTEFIKKITRKSSRQVNKYSKNRSITGAIETTPRLEKNPYKISHVVIETLDPGSIFVILNFDIFTAYFHYNPL